MYTEIFLNSEIKKYQPIKLECSNKCQKLY